MKLIEKLNQRFGEAIRNDVVRDIAARNFVRQTQVRKTARVAALGIICTPYLMMALGVILIIAELPNIPLIVFGSLILFAGFYLRPTPHRNLETTLTAANLPKLFGLLDQIASGMNAPLITGIHLNADFNAYVTEFGPHERVIGIGAPLWLSLDPPERIAILAHEVAHLVNNDPARGQLTGAALGTLARWVDLFDPPVLIDQGSNSVIIIDDQGFLGEAVSGAFGGFVKAIAFAYEKLVFADCQRAEYLADLQAATVSGALAMQSALKKLILVDLAYRSLSHAHYDGSKKARIFHDMAQAVRNPDPDISKRLYEEAFETLHTVDSTHPPTRYRMEVVAAVGASDSMVDPAQVDWDGIENELSSFFAKEEGKILSKILIQ